jgi:parallel beta-helix repeat protein
MKLLCLIHLLLMAFVVCAADYHVATEGDDNAAGSKEHPWKTIQKAANALQPGDTVHIHEGIYREKLSINHSGSAKAPISLMAIGKVVLSGKGVPGDHMIHLKDRSHVRIVGFEICEHLKVNDGSGIRVEGSGSDIELRNNHIHDIRGQDAMGITIYGTHAERPLSDIRIIGNLIHDCEAAESEALTLNGNVADFRITGNVVRDINNIGICMIGGEDWINQDRTRVTRNGVCSGNKVFRCNSNYGGGFAAGIYVDGGSDIVVEDNEVSGCDLGIEVGAENKGTVARRIIVKGNHLWKNQKAGLVFGGYEESAGRVTECSFLNNFCQENDQHSDVNGELWMQWASGNLVRGNTFWAGAESMMLQAEAAGTDNTLEGNSWFSEEGSESALFVWKGEDLEGFSTYLKKTGKDKGAQFSKPKAPVRSKF